MELLNYHGLLNEQAKGLQVDLPPKPEAKKLWEQCVILGTGIYDGGAIDQPVIFMQEVAVINKIAALFENLRKRNEANNG